MGQPSLEPVLLRKGNSAQAFLPRRAPIGAPIVTRIAERLDRRTRYGNGERHFPKKGNEERTSFGTFFGNGIRDFGSLVLKLSLNSKLQ